MSANNNKQEIQHNTQRYEVALSVNAIHLVLFLLEKEREKIEVRIGVAKQQLMDLEHRHDIVSKDIIAINLQLKEVNNR